MLSAFPVMTANLPCPDCGKPGRMLQVAGVWVDYYVCDACHAAWTTDWRDPQSLPHLITKPKHLSAQP